MNNVYILSTGATPVGELYSRTLEDLALEALRGAVTGAHLSPDTIGALYIGNAYGEAMAGQGNLGAVLANAAGLTGIPAYRVEGAGASGGMALHLAAQAIQSGAHELVAVLGVEKITDRFDTHMEAARALALDSNFEAEHGITPTAQWALLMRRYMHTYGCEAAAFAPFPVNAHANAKSNPGAMYRFPISVEKYVKAGQVSSPINMLDSASAADGAAVVLLASERFVRELNGSGLHLLALNGSAVATDTLRLADRRDPLWLDAAARSANAAMQAAAVQHAAIDVLELTDPHGITAALALEASGFVERGTATRHAADGGIGPAGSTPLATAGGYKARGDVGGASGVFQVVEVARQLRGEAGAAQVSGATVGFAQCLGGVGSVAVTHIVKRED